MIQCALEEDKSQSQDEVQSEPLMIEGDASNLSCSDVADMVASETWRAWQPCQRIVEEGMKQLTTSQQCWHACSAHMQFPLIPPFLVLMWEQLLSAGRQFIAVSKKNMLQIAGFHGLFILLLPLQWQLPLLLAHLQCCGSWGDLRQQRTLLQDTDRKEMFYLSCQRPGDFVDSLPAFPSAVVCLLDYPLLGCLFGIPLALLAVLVLLDLAGVAFLPLSMLGMIFFSIVKGHGVMWVCVKAFFAPGCQLSLAVSLRAECYVCGRL